jgi:hypothetical protein
MLLVGGVIPVLHKVKTVSPKLGVIWWTLLDLNWLYIIYLYYFLVCAYLACASVNSVIENKKKLSKYSTGAIDWIINVNEFLAETLKLLTCL